LKSTHDMATWSEKQGAHHVNNADTNITLDELALGRGPVLQRTGRLVNQWLGTENIEIRDTPLSLPNEELNPALDRTGGSRIVTTWPVLKSTHDAANLSEKRGNLCVNDFKSCYSEPPQEGLDDIELSNTPLSQPNEPLLPASNQPVQHTIISTGPVLKSTHDMASWSEKQGTQCVNTLESNMVIDEVAQSDNLAREEVEIPLAPPFMKRGFRKSWRRAARWQGTENLDVADTPLSQPNEALLPASGEQQPESTVLHSWTVLKSTHDNATWSEKLGTDRVNPEEASLVIDELATNQSQGMENFGQGCQKREEPLITVTPPITTNLGGPEGINPLIQSPERYF